MRTTLTLDLDTVSLLEKVRHHRHIRLKQIINEALRIGLSAMNQPQKKRPRFHTKAVSLGRCLVDNMDNIAELLEMTEERPKL